MKRAFRWFWNGLTVLSMLLCVATVVLWVWTSFSPVAASGIYYDRPAPLDRHRWQGWVYGSKNGNIGIGRMNEEEGTDQADSTWQYGGNGALHAFEKAITETHGLSWTSTILSGGFSASSLPLPTPENHLIATSNYVERDRIFCTSFWVWGFLHQCCPLSA